MIGRGDFWLAVGAAAGVHLAALTLWPMGTHGGGSGADGSATISVAAANPTLQALVESWQQPPEVVAAPKAPPRTAMLDVPQRPAVESTLAMAQTLQPLPLPLRLEPAPDRVETPGSLIPPDQVALQPVAIATRTAPQPPRNKRRVETALAPPPIVDAASPETRTIANAPRPDPRPSRPAVAERRAAGTGGGATTGRATANAARAVSPAERASAQARWAADIQRSIARHQAYPRGARANGRVQVSMVILRNGALGEVTVARSSGADRLDRAALRAVQLAAPFPPAPDALTDTWYRVGQWISFERR